MNEQSRFATNQRKSMNQQSLLALTLAAALMSATTAFAATAAPVKPSVNGAVTDAGAAAAAAAGAALTAFHAALGAGDKDTALALMAPDVTIYESGYVERSRADYASHHLADDIAFAKTAKRKVLSHSARVDGKLAIVLDETETTGNSHGKAVHAFGTETTILERIDAHWLITHVHWSSRRAK
jgi:ketosteroid isomerase-like protein